MNVREDLKAFIDDELTAERRTEVQRELDADLELQREMEFMRLLGSELRSAALQPSAEGKDRTLRWLERRQTKRRVINPRLQWALAGAGCFLLAAILFPVFAQSKAASKRTAALMKEREAAAASAPHGFAGTAKDFDDKTPASPAEAPVAGGGFRRENRKSTMGRNPSDPENLINGSPSVPPQAIPTQQPLMIRSGQISLEVEEVEEAVKKATRQIEAMGGMVQNSNVSGAENERGSAEIVVRVPESKFTAAMEGMEAIGKPLSHSSTGEDATTQVADVEARLKVMRAEEQQYVLLLRAARTIGQIMEVRDRLSSVRQEIESLDAQRKSLRAQTSYSTITVTMQEKNKDPKALTPPPANWSEDTLTSSKEVLFAIGRFLARAAIFLGVLAPIWIPLGLVAWFLRRRYAR